MTTFSNLAIVTLFNITKFKRGALLACSLKQQSIMLKAAHSLVKAGQADEANLLLNKWKRERTCYKIALKLQGV